METINVQPYVDEIIPHISYSCSNPQSKRGSLAYTNSNVPARGTFFFMVIFYWKNRNPVADRCVDIRFGTCRYS